MLDNHEIGLMCQPASNPPRAGWIWAADNGCFASTWKSERWMAWLRKEMPKSGCLFATVPDVVGDHLATCSRWDLWSPFVRSVGFPLAFVAQNGADEATVPWEECDALFIGGTTEWKMSLEAFRLAAAARERGKWVHVGRVNSLRRLRQWKPYADSSDGTHLAFEPSRAAIRVQGWVKSLREDAQEQLEWVREPS